MNNKKSKVKINAFDVFVVLLVLCLLATIVFKIYASVTKDDNAKNSEITMSFKCEGEYNSLVKYINSGDEVYLESGELLGYIYKSPDSDELFVITPREEALEKEDTNSSSKVASNIKITTYEKIDFTGNIKLNGNAIKSSKGNYYTIGSDNITVGGKLDLHTKRTEFTITVTGFSEESKY